jgi:hypothetical protein
VSSSRTRSEPSKSSRASTSAGMASWSPERRAYSSASHSVIRCLPPPGSPENELQGDYTLIQPAGQLLRSCGKVSTSGPIAAFGRLFPHAADWCFRPEVGSFSDYPCGRFSASAVIRHCPQLRSNGCFRERPPTGAFGHNLRKHGSPVCIRPSRPIPINSVDGAMNKGHFTGTIRVRYRWMR